MNNNLIEKAFNYTARRDYRKAWNIFEEIDKTGKLTEEQFNSYLKCAKILHKPNAKELFEKGLKKYPDFLHIKRNFADFLIRTKDFNYAEKLVNELLEYDPRDFYSIDLRAEIFSKTNRLKDAVDIMDKKLNNPSIMNKSAKGEGGEMEHTFRSFFKILEEHLDVIKAKSYVIDLLLKEGKTIDNINLAFDEVECNESFTTLKTKYKLTPKLNEFVDTYSHLFGKVDKLFKLFKQKEIDKDKIENKEKLVKESYIFFQKARTVIIKLSDNVKKIEFEKKYSKKSIFISYSRKDRYEAMLVHDKLKSVGYEVRIDEFVLEINDYLAGKLKHLVQNSDYVISIVSKNSLLSEWVGIESIETLLYERYKNPTRKFISLVVDNRVFDNPFYLEIIREIDNNYDKLLDLTVDAGKLRVSSEIYDISRERLIDLRNNMKDIFIRIREYLSLDCSDIKNFDSLFEKLIQFIEQPKPSIAA